MCMVEQLDNGPIVLKESQIQVQEWALKYEE